eukprot:TRINITY_DN15999_c0_g1_i3.p1 TRINITY_DN15999_c0_g1~~TRINITY_DN15999_c0_g1_i3.p1  ORF type:complete len:400 (-),score=102.69 TRINITY_DN15999_c0_g1_i3:816-2015(-)
MESSFRRTLHHLRCLRTSCDGNELSIPANTNAFTLSSSFLPVLLSLPFSYLRSLVVHVPPREEETFYRIAMNREICELKFTGDYDAMDSHMKNQLEDMLLLMSETLSSIAVIDVRIEDHDVVKICELMKNCPRCRSIQIKGNRLTWRGLEGISSVVASHSSLVEINVSHNPFGDDGITYLANAIEATQSLRSLLMNECTVGNDGSAKIAMALVKNSSIRTLELKNNCIGDAGALHFGRVLGEISVVYLDLAGNDISERGSHQLALGLSKNTLLQFLSISLNPIGVKGARSFADALVLNQTLRTLRVSGCEIGSNGAKEIGRGLSRNGRLQSIAMSMNDIEEHGFAGVVSGISQSSTLREIDLSMNTAGMIGSSSIQIALTMNACLVQIDLAGKRQFINH